MEVKIMSREIIKPSIQTHDQEMKTLQLSMLDQISSPTYTSVVLFYPKNHSEDSHFEPESVSSKLRSSLSETLNHFRVLAGRMLDDGIDCSDQGVLFLEAKVGTEMNELLTNPQLELMSLLLPFQSAEVVEFSVQIAVQLNLFSCGGIAIGGSFLHKLIDGTTFSYFFKSWGSITKGLSQKLPDFDYRVVSELFPPRKTETSWFVEGCPFMAKGNVSTRRFAFEREEISKLKAEAMSKTVPNPTSVEVVTGWIWKYALKAARERSGADSPSVIFHLVNFRSKMNPPLQENAIGNLFWITIASHDAATGRPTLPLGELVGLVRKSFEKINGDFMHKIKGNDGFDQILKLTDEAKELYFKTRRSYLFSSWRNLGLNEVDFGWGKPVWVSFGGSKNFRNAILLLDAQDGDGLQAWVVLDEEEMKIFENDEEFLAMASLNPPINQQFSGSAIACSEYEEERSNLGR